MSNSSCAANVTVNNKKERWKFGAVVHFCSTAKKHPPHRGTHLPPGRSSQDSVKILNFSLRGSLLSGCRAQAGAPHPPGCCRKRFWVQDALTQQPGGWKPAESLSTALSSRVLPLSQDPHVQSRQAAVPSLPPVTRELLQRFVFVPNAGL